MSKKETNPESVDQEPALEPKDPFELGKLALECEFLPARNKEKKALKALCASLFIRCPVQKGTGKAAFDLVAHAKADARRIKEGMGPEPIRERLVEFVGGTESVQQILGTVSIEGGKVNAEKTSGAVLESALELSCMSGKPLGFGYLETLIIRVPLNEGLDKPIRRGEFPFKKLHTLHRYLAGLADQSGVMLSASHRITEREVNCKEPRRAKPAGATAAKRGGRATAKKAG